MTNNSTSTNAPINAKPPESAGSFLHHIWASIAFTVTLGIICCGIYPAIIWGLSQLIFPNQANGSLVKKDGTYTTKDEEAVGSSLLGQPFSANGYFWPRPSAAGNGYDPTASSGSNLGPLSDKLINGVTTPATTPAAKRRFRGNRCRCARRRAGSCSCRRRARGFSGCRPRPRRSSAGA